MYLTKCSKIISSTWTKQCLFHSLLYLWDPAASGTEWVLTKYLLNLSAHDGVVVVVSGLNCVLTYFGTWLTLKPGSPITGLCRNVLSSYSVLLEEGCFPYKLV